MAEAQQEGRAAPLNRICWRSGLGVGHTERERLLGLPFVALLRLMALKGACRSDLIDVHLRRYWLGIERLPRMHREGWQGPRTASACTPFAGFYSSPACAKRHSPNPDALAGGTRNHFGRNNTAALASQLVITALDETAAAFASVQQRIEKMQATAASVNAIDGPVAPKGGRYPVTHAASPGSLLTANEARIDDKRDPLPVGDILYQPLNMASRAAMRGSRPRAASGVF